ncbi:uncharacterized protein OCT59_023997 [Rhizophagus irregularis]|uniref:Uncharacterized protein n=2 Tax=Rhizophagus irregularis TaxID=588596 RepID=U9SWF0_RHIID|nr:hypothetical protein GLOIN_2v1674122 [Rhizophagus irregularis DAOM 181602=DAOM 197198]EXX59594.1 hypothetical protein RirG_187690 [Rhizophagus irregularis DAOM 197198w]UZO03593.1 hypothetical protein OCT59_023997 [Rhizophagus irregularis]POG64525.1 hypothetical protein GLOIN_2v1674122 [Rhizophagus irregularis DAOM 181602=DAOM 197198]CAG8733828.1 18633_t:CDS:1 [Rhizophagus irregularis]GBC22120.1 hypothetical protein GLOIN_2v1674122 [Rhizophagus irregularis DAOM 181602=DAOM 197198]|eukprot:XP_025171391.1 hypothetical protein GLOIN_2v1674122 [Rhizophagus irregularis DAOM 181602=DAOM 197198]
MALEKKAQDEISTFKNMEEDLNWITHTKCKAHGFSCGGSFSQEVASGVHVIQKDNAASFGENHFSYLDQKPKEILKSNLKSLFDTEGSAFTYKYIDIKCGEDNVDKPITGGFYFMYASADNGGKRTVFIGLVQITKSPASGHYFLKDYYEGNDDRVEKALKYIMYKDVKSKNLLSN